MLKPSAVWVDPDGVFSIDDKTLKGPMVLPLRLLLENWSEENGSLLAAFFCRDEPSRELVIHLSGLYADTLYSDFFLRMASTPLPEVDHDALVSALIRVAARDADRDDDGIASVWKDMLKPLMGGQPANGKSLDCAQTS